MHTTKLIIHKDDNRIAVTFAKKQELISRFKKLNGAKWSITYPSYTRQQLENRTGLSFIMELLGHNSSKTTEIYTHVSTKSLQNIKSPFDDL